MYRLLANVIYTGKVNHKGTIYPGEHSPIVDTAVWQQVNDRLRGNGVNGGREVRNKYGALLRGLLHCDACNAGMVHSYTVKGTRRYRYYVCLTARQRGWDACPTKSVAAQMIEDAIVSRVRRLGADPRIAAETARKLQEQSHSHRDELDVAFKRAEKELSRLQRELSKVVVTPTGNGLRIDRMAELQEQIRAAEPRAAGLRAEVDAVAADRIDDGDLQKALEAFDPVWNALNVGEQTRLIRAVIDRIGFDGRTGKTALTFRAAGFKVICTMAAEELAT